MRSHRLALVLLTATITSCGPSTTPPPPAQQPPLTRPATPGPTAPGSDFDPAKDAVPGQNYLVQITAYHITLPRGAVSRSEEFWKHINEQVVDVGTYELLFKNGMRVGVAKGSEWEYLKNILDNNPAVTVPGALTGREAKDLDIDMRKGIEYQNIFYWDGEGELVGRTYERCDNLMRLSFQPAPRKHGTIRMTLCPVVKSLRERLVPVGDINTRTIQRVFPEQIFDLNMTVDIPHDSILIVSPSPEARWPTRLGATFLIRDAAAQQVETLLIFKPVVFRQRMAPVAEK